MTRGAEGGPEGKVKIVFLSSQPSPLTEMFMHSVTTRDPSSSSVTVLLQLRLCHRCRPVLPTWSCRSSVSARNLAEASTTCSLRGCNHWQLCKKSETRDRHSNVLYKSHLTCDGLYWQSLYWLSPSRAQIKWICLSYKMIIQLIEISFTVNMYLYEIRNKYRMWGFIL